MNRKVLLRDRKRRTVANQTLVLSRGRGGCTLVLSGGTYWSCLEGTPWSCLEKGKGVLLVLSVGGAPSGPVQGRATHWFCLGRGGTPGPVWGTHLTPMWTNKLKTLLSHTLRMRAVKKALNSFYFVPRSENFDGSLVTDNKSNMKKNIYFFMRILLLLPCWLNNFGTMK